MDQKVRERRDQLDALAQKDVAYICMLRDMVDMEKKYDAVLRKLSDDDRNAVCDFVSQCEDMSWRMLELACMFMQFPQE